MFGILFAALVAAAVPAPISIAHCDFLQSGSFARGLHVVYTNRSHKTAKSVTFEVRHGSHRAQIVDSGTFSQGAKVDHVLIPRALQLYHGAEPEGCVVTHVRYADGSSWTAPPF